ncbi:MAG: GNAT family N-acetyltransferase [Quisquiliibacterium sp.]
MNLDRPNYRTRLVEDLGQVGRDRWDALVRASIRAFAPPDTPPPASEVVGDRPDPLLPAFLRYDFLQALATTGCVGAGTGWQPLFLTLWQGRELVAATPLYAKSHSYGEYVFDWGWADAYERHGLRYYPKLLSAIPFTPVSSQRLLAVNEQARSALLDTLLDQARQSGLSSLHLLYPTASEAQALRAAGLMLRSSVQFHWHNSGHQDFESFLASLAQPKRKKIRAERRKVAQAGVSFKRLVGRAIEPQHWEFFARCYQNTYAEHHSSPYLNKAFFLRIGQTMPENLVLVLASRDSRPIATSLLVRDATRLYGRYWGALERVDCLHFETAYYQAIEAAIELGALTLEGGAHGEHKMARGFLPEATCSAHWLAEPAFADAVDRFLAREGNAMAGYIDELRDRSPFITKPG